VSEKCQRELALWPFLPFSPIEESVTYVESMRTGSSNPPPATNQNSTANGTLPIIPLNARARVINRRAIFPKFSRYTRDRRPHPRPPPSKSRAGVRKDIDVLLGSPRLTWITPARNSWVKRRIQKFSGLSSGSLGEGRVHRAAKQRGPCRQSLHVLHSCLAKELAESFEADRIWSSSIRPGAFILHDQKAICHRQKPSQQWLLLLNEVQRICHENSVDRWETEAGALQIPNDLTNLHSIVLVWNSLQSSPVQIDGINRAAGSQ
jgi:hypothetical protein